MRRWLFLVLLAACGGEADSPDAGPAGPTPFADRVVSFEPGESAGFGESQLPDIVLGPPKGRGASAGSLDVLSLGREGVIVLAFDDLLAVDGPGPDLLVFENAFSGFIERAHVAASEDGVTWHEWPCEPENAEQRYPGCAGVASVFSDPGNGIEPTDPENAGGDAFDLADVGLQRARFLRIRDSGFNSYEGTSGGFDLDAAAVVHSEAAP